MSVITAAAAASSLPSAAESICYPISNGIACNSIKTPIDGRTVHDLTTTRCKSPIFGSPRFLWPCMGHDLCLSKIGVAADYSDSIPDSSSYMNKQGYHPLEELKVSKNIPPAKLSSAEIARTTVEANKNALLVFPGTVHCEPHEQISWTEFQYLIDDYGEIYVEIFDDANLLEDPEGHNSVIALIGTDIPMYDKTTTISLDDLFNSGNTDEFPPDDDNNETPEKEQLSTPVIRAVSDESSPVHPIYFSKCLEKAVDMECVKRMNHPSNGVSILGFLRPAYDDEVSYIRMIYHTEDGDGYNSDWKGEDCDSNSIDDQRDTNMILYRLEIEKIKLHFVYGTQSEISLPDFQDAEPDSLVHSTSAILDNFNQNYNDALKGFCKKKGLDAEATSVQMAEKQIMQLLFPRSRRRKYKKTWRSPQNPE